MAKPTLDGNTLEYPTTWTVEHKVGKSEHTTLQGVLKTDLIYRKNIYRLRYDVMSKVQYEVMLGVINNIIDNNNSLAYFQYDKITDTTPGSGVTVIPEVSSATRVSGSGLDYFMSVEITLKEIMPK